MFPGTLVLGPQKLKGKDDVLISMTVVRDGRLLLSELVLSKVVRTLPKGPGCGSCFEAGARYDSETEALVPLGARFFPKAAD